MIVALNATPTVPLIDAEVITGFAGLIVIVKVPAPNPVIFFAVSFITKVPAVVGVPLITPVVVFKINPDGKADEL